MRGNAPDTDTTKPSNPKSSVGAKKLDLGLVPETALVSLAMAFLEGALKYGRYNWRIAGVSASTYYAAQNRHMKKWWNGQDADPKTRVNHLDNAMACIAIIRDAEVYGMLTDDRPPCPDPDAMARLIDDAEGIIAHLKAEFAGHSPHQFTIADTPRPVLVEEPDGHIHAACGTDINGDTPTDPIPVLGLPRARGYKRPDGSWSGGDDPLHVDIPHGLPVSLPVDFDPGD